MSEPLRVVHFLQRFDLREGGVVRSVLDMARAQADAGAEVLIAAADASDVPDEWADEGPRVVPLAGTRRGLEPEAAARLVKELGGGVLHAHAIWSGLLMPVIRAAREAGAPVVISGHGMLSDWALAKSAVKKRVYLAIGLGRVLRNADALHFACSIEQQQATARMRFRRAAVIPLIVHGEAFETMADPELARREWPMLAGDVPTVLFLSRVFPGKGLEPLIDASAALVARGIDHRLVIAGPAEDSYRSEIEERIERAGIGSRAALLGMVRGDLKQSLLRLADLMALPSDHENFSVSLFESLASGTPVLASDRVQTGDELVASGAAEIVRRDPAAIAGALERMLADRDALAARGSAAREWFFREFDASRVAGRYFDLYRSVLGSRA